MESKIQSLLPPSKRFRLRHQEDNELSVLPAKKRKESRNIPIEDVFSLLPAKKRVWALPPSPESEPETKSDSPSEEDDGILCCVCGSTDGDSSDPIVLCDGCDLMVHASCYGSPLIDGIPDGDWFCSVCLSGSTPRCKLCPAPGGAMKPTKDGGWAHLVCALFVPEVFFEDAVGREGVDCSHLPLDGYKEPCYICTAAVKGVAIGCSEPGCGLAFHVTCGLSQGLCIEYTQGRKPNSKAVVHGFCKDHTDLWNKQQRTGKYKIVARDDRNA